ncbi:MAG: hypothetical protein Ct9H90mP16_14100 [Candidatus Poseidoniales archaeon]|nr:MAG: hypothetical protein Ct9H90mP16_14100 [Candidatus Poseidoniales archaeon]
MVMNPSAKILLGMVVHLHGAILFGIALVVRTLMEMVGRIPAMPVKAKVWQVLLVMRMHSSTIQPNGTIQMEMDLVTTSRETWGTSVPVKQVPV